MRDSQKIVNKLSKCSALPRAEKLISYSLVHTYEIEACEVYVQAPYDYETFNAICAYIQYECAELDDSFSMEQSNVLEVLEQFYDCRKGESTQSEQVDLYINWEWFCGTGLQEVKCLKRDGMNVLFQRFVGR